MRNHKCLQIREMGCCQFNFAGRGCSVATSKTFRIGFNAVNFRFEAFNNWGIIYDSYHVPARQHVMGLAYLLDFRLLESGGLALSKIRRATSSGVASSFNTRIGGRPREPDS